MEEVKTYRPMVTVAPNRVPEPYVRAEVATWPLTSLTAFTWSMTELDPGFESDRLLEPECRPTFQLWRACEKHLAEHASGWSLDRLVNVRDGSWFNVDPIERRRPGPVPLHRYLRHLVCAHIEPMHGSAELHHDPGTCAIDVMYHYYWLTFALPEDLLLAAVSIQPPPRRVKFGASVGTTLFERRLSDFGIAEIHQHSGAGLDFPLVWAGALATLADPNLTEDAMESPGAWFQDGRGFARWLLVAAITRIVLGEFLIAQQGPARRDPRVMSLREFLRARFDRPSHQRRTLSEALRALVRAPVTQPPPFADLHALYAELFGGGVEIAVTPPRCLDDAWCCDPIGARLGLADYGDGERWLVRHGLAYLECCECRGLEPDREFAGAFWQVQRLRCLFYRYIVERPLTSGLQWFIRFYDRIDRLAKPLHALMTESSFRLAGGGQGHLGAVVGALEIRKGARDHPIELAEELRRVVASWQEVLKQRDTMHLGSDAELGIVIGLVKCRDAENLWSRGCPKPFGEGTHAQPVGHAPSNPRLKDTSFDARLTRFDRVCTNLALKAWAVGDLLCAEPELLWLVRGIDVCSDELAVPTWVLVPFYRYLRQESEFASVLPRSHGAPPLRVTAHVGEDYRHLMEGLRHIGESTTYLLRRSGGRLGHATALGVEPRAWAASAAPVLVPAEDRLWDLVFEWRLYSDPRVSPEFIAIAPPGRQERLNNLIMDQAHEFLGSGRHGPELTPRNLADVHHRLHSFMDPMPGHLLRRGDLDRAIERGQYRFFSAGGIYETLWQSLQDPDTFRRGQQLQDVSIDESEIEAMVAVQNALRRGIAARGIVVEVNPTSNLLIGNLLDLRHHPLLRLCPIEPDETTPPVKVAIGSDDPIVFSTSLLHEYELMEMTARGAGYPEQTVHDWLERIRQTAFDARFTLPWRPRSVDVAKRLERALDRYLQTPKGVGMWSP